MRGKRKRVFANIITEFLGKAIVIIISIAIPKLFIDNYGSEYNGLLTSLHGIFIYLNLLEAGIGSASIQALYKPIVDKDTDQIDRILSATRKNYYHNGVYFLACLSITAFLYPYFSHTDIDYYLVVALVFISAAPYILKFFFRGKFTVLLTADNRLYIINLASNIFHIIANVIRIILLVNKVNVIFVQATFGITTMLEVIVYYIYIRKNYDVDFKATPDFQAISKSRSAMVHEIAHVVFGNTDVLLLTYFCGLKMVSIYCVYNLIFSHLSQLLQSMTNGTNSALGQLLFENKGKYIKNYYTFEYLFQCISCAVIVSAGAVTREFVALYTIHASDIDYLIPGITELFVAMQILSLLRWPGMGAIKASGMFKETQGRALTEMSINLILSLILVKPFGIHGLLIGTIAALLYRTVDVIYFTEKRILADSGWRRAARILLLIVFTVAVFSIEHQFPFEPVSYLYFALHGAAVLVVNAVLFVFFYMGTRRIHEG